MKTSKLSMLFMGILLALPLSFSSCSDDDDDEVGSSSNIVGSWQSTYLYCWETQDGYETVWYDGADDTRYIIFYKDGTWVGAEDLVEYDRGVWSVENGKIKMISSYGDNNEKITGTLNGDKLTIEEIDYDDDEENDYYVERTEYEKVTDNTSLWTFKEW